ncbi:hypothetical protein NQ317_011535 [Molorchus minor]|uniref:Peptidase A2 domain-containing protein n=1 Tax=Molorchus minor TaxID=1323400 RepID=A0ABQ9K557_9CUCU|nr:hypothetical protein NQ317_011535 [Molorchus minor]
MTINFSLSEPIDEQFICYFWSLYNGWTGNRNTLIRKMLKMVATYLNLPNPTENTGHCLRRSSATMLFDSGGDITSLKKLGG